MSWEQLNNAITFRAHYVASKVGKTGLTVTVDVFNPAGTLIVTAAAATEVGDGIYSYTLAAGSVTTKGEYVAVFKTTDATVDQQHVPSLWIVGRDGDQYLDAAVSSRAAIADYTTARAAKIDNLDAAVSSRATIAAIFGEPVPGAYATNTAGARIGLIGAGTVTLTQVLSPGGSVLAFVRGDSYLAAEGRQVTLASSAWPNLTGTSPTGILMTIRRRAEAFTTPGEAVLLTANDTVASRVLGAGTQTLVFELPAASTAALLPGTATGKFDVQATLPDGAIVTLVTGTVNVTEDQTRP